MDLPNQAALPFQGAAHLAFRLIDPIHRASKGVAQLLDLARGPKPARQFAWRLYRLTRSQAISAAAIHINNGSSRSNRSVTVVRSWCAAIRATSRPSPIGQSL